MKLTDQRTFLSHQVKETPKLRVIVAVMKNGCQGKTKIIARNLFHISLVTDLFSFTDRYRNMNKCITVSVFFSVFKPLKTGHTITKKSSSNTATKPKSHQVDFSTINLHTVVDNVSKKVPRVFHPTAGFSQINSYIYTSFQDFFLIL